MEGKESLPSRESKTLLQETDKCAEKNSDGDEDDGDDESQLFNI